MNRYNGPPMTRGNAAAARVRLIVWCLDTLRGWVDMIATGTERR